RAQASAIASVDGRWVGPAPRVRMHDMGVPRPEIRVLITPKTGRSQAPRAPRRCSGALRPIAGGSPTMQCDNPDTHPRSSPMSDVVIVGAKRTAIGSMLGQFTGVPTPTLGAAAIGGALDHARVNADQVDEVIMGCVLPAGLGQAPARQASRA